MQKQKRVITVQDISCVGRCSLTVALPIISAAGIETSILPTAVLSTHTGGFTGFTFRDLTEDIKPITEHWKALGFNVDAIYTGFLGSLEQIDLVGKLFDDFKQKDTIIMVDPAMADLGELYPIFNLDYANQMAKLCAKADIIVPNITEASFILEKPYPGDNYDQAYIEETLKELAALGPSKVVLTGVSFEAGKLGAAAYDAHANNFDYFFSDKIDGHFHGTGDIYASALISALTSGFALADAIRIAVLYTLEAIKRTHLAQTDPKYGVDFEGAIPTLIKLLDKS